jgi:hypothetical protein
MSQTELDFESAAITAQWAFDTASGVGAAAAMSTNASLAAIDDWNFDCAEMCGLAK